MKGEMSDNALSHYGILGMRWGVRRERGADGRVGTKKQSAEQQIRADRKKAVRERSTMPSEQLKERISRLEMEKKLRELTSSELERGNRHVNEVLRNSGKKAATAVATAALIYGVKAAMTRDFSIKDFAGHIAKPGKK